MSLLPIAFNNEYSRMMLVIPTFFYKKVKKASENLVLLHPAYYIFWSCYRDFKAQVLVTYTKHYSKLVLFYRFFLNLQNNKTIWILIDLNK